MFFFINIRRFRCIVLSIYVFLHCSPHLFQSVQCTLVIKPESVAAVNGETVSLSCASDSEDSVAWVAYSPGSSEREYIFNGGRLSQRYSSYISFSQQKRQFNLQINVTRIAAKRYICVEKGSTMEASAELIVLERKPLCISIHTDESVNITCSVKFAGNWAPTMEWKTNDNQKLEAELDSSHNDLVASALFLPLKLTKDTAYKINVITQFSESGRPKEATATNVPEYNHTISPYASGYDCMNVPNTGRIVGICHDSHAVIVLSIVVALLITGIVALTFIILRCWSRDSNNS